MFLDEKSIEVRSGKGGDGICSFHREKFVPLGGPDGGDGGRGGHVILQVNEQYSTLLDMGNARLYKARPGQAGGAKRCTGKSAEDLIVDVPKGTIVKDAEGRILADLTEDGQRWIAARGGKGGMGNQHFATPSNQAPRKCTPGEAGEKRELFLELKLMADVGLVGFPNAGKSSLVNKISSGRPKVGDYPFTTLEPVLGIVQMNGHSFVVADIPGLLEGASEGKGLGHQFLKHIERTHTLLFVIDGFAENAFEQFSVLKSELAAFHPKLAKKPYVIALNKNDLGIDNAIKEFADHKEKVIVTSAVTGDGCRELQQALDEAVPHIQKKKVGWESKKVVEAKTMKAADKTKAKAARKEASTKKTSAKTAAPKATARKAPTRKAPAKKK
ncbi:MAG: GTPase ObgE [Candidatus Saccharibacteria bacterium]|nr:GTPase ObgE [Candidatus Saccharibacteria bacterium]